ncbi:hypothetical protein FC14_GL001033 [Ligilactobacillus agilis DSM 20509]|uniref:Uncharacterized protein n=1 Tax=Ligilactobacillus agilis DSM 20509 TaxID=1423718 RepID=A0A0R2AGC0_9LACO|nr:hypothetical protein [Ligilactobacillus agilis]KRM65749.1 hypothetical protein FC14_GL001033 [Ligilactobacillus agilis DSM 20509]
MNLVITQVQEQLTAAKTAGKRVIFLTHFVPHRDLLWARPGLEEDMSGKQLTLKTNGWLAYRKLKSTRQLASLANCLAF